MGSRAITAYPSNVIRDNISLAHLRYKPQRHPIITPALARRLWPVLEHVAVVAAAFGAVVFGAWQHQFVIGLFDERAGDGGEEAGPAGTGFEFHGRSEERQRATLAHKHTGALFAVERAATCALGAFLAQHAECLRC